MASNYDLHAIVVDYLSRKWFGRTLNLILSRINDVEKALDQSVSTWYGTDPVTGTLYGAPHISDFPHMRITYSGAATWMDMRTRIDELRVAGGIVAFPWVFTPAYADYTSGSPTACIDARQLLELLQAIGRIVPDKVGYKLHKVMRFSAGTDETQGIDLPRWTDGASAMLVEAESTGALNDVFCLDANVYLSASQKRIMLVNWGDRYFYPGSAYQVQNTGILADPPLETSLTFWISWYDAVEREVYTPRRYGPEDDSIWWEPDIKPDLFKMASFWVNVYKRTDDVGDATLDWLEEIGDSMEILLQVTLGESSDALPASVDMVDNYRGKFSISSNTIIDKSVRGPLLPSFTIQGQVATHHDLPPLITTSTVDLITGYESPPWNSTASDLYAAAVLSPVGAEGAESDPEEIDSEDPFSIDEDGTESESGTLLCRSSAVAPNSLDDLVNAAQSTDGEYFWYIPEDGVDQYYDWMDELRNVENGQIRRTYEEYEKVNEEHLLEILGEPEDQTGEFQFPARPRANVGEISVGGNPDTIEAGFLSSGSIDAEFDAEEGYHARKIAYAGGLSHHTSEGSLWIVWASGYTPVAEGWPDVLKPTEVT